MPLKTSSCEELPSVNLTSMIDVVFLLLIFFMVGTQFTKSERQIDLQLPSAGELKPMVAPPDQRVIVVTEGGQFELDGQAVSLDQLAAKLRGMQARYPELRVAVRADARVQYQFVSAAFSSAQGAGVKSVGIDLVTSRPLQR